MATLLAAVPVLCSASQTSPTPPVAAAAAAAVSEYFPNPLPQREEARPAKMTDGARAGRPRLSNRALGTEPAHIEAVLSRYADMSPPPANLAQGVAHWDPPPAALRQMGEGLREPTNHKYGPALGENSLREALVRKLEKENGLDMNGQEVTRLLHNRWR